jgi:hypothetical protein
VCPSPSSCWGQGDRSSCPCDFSKRLAALPVTGGKERRDVSDVLVCGVRGSMQSGLWTRQKGTRNKALPPGSLFLRFPRDCGAAERTLALFGWRASTLQREGLLGRSLCTALLLSDIGGVMWLSPSSFNSCQGEYRVESQELTSSSPLSLQSS